MSPEMIELARRAVACKGWKWLPGMLDIHGGRVVSVEGGLLRLDYRDDDDPIRTSTSACLPDLTDPATLGCLLALVREAWGQEDMGAVRIFRDGLRKWCVEYDEDDAQVGAFYGPTEADALVAALEACAMTEDQDAEFERLLAAWKEAAAEREALLYSLNREAVRHAVEKERAAWFAALNFDTVWKGKP